jgi:hypothetical protein
MLFLELIFKMLVLIKIKISQMNTKIQPKIKIIEIKKMLFKSLNFKSLIKSNLLKSSDG